MRAGMCLRLYRELVRIGRALSARLAEGEEQQIDLRGRASLRRTQVERSPGGNLCSLGL